MKYKSVCMCACMHYIRPKKIMDFLRIYLSYIHIIFVIYISKHYKSEFHIHFLFIYDSCFKSQ